jgi:dTDP-4-amino-4,6-dideoxygalactose transaminase
MLHELAWRKISFGKAGSAMIIPFNRPTTVGDELCFIADAVTNAKLAGDGHYTFACEKEIIALTGGGATCLLTHSCTAALEMIALLLKLKAGDEVIMPSFTFASTANAVVLRGATPVFVDIRPDTLNLNEHCVAEAITDRTRAVFVVHYAGVPAEVDAIEAAVAGRGIVIAEDAAQAFGSRYRGRPAGSLGAMAAFSFHETKNVVSGEGGALVMRDRIFAARAEIIREKGTNRRQFLDGAVDKYAWVDVGSSYLPSELVAAFLYAQLLARDRILRERMLVWDFYKDALTDLADYGFRLPVVPEHCHHNAHLFYLIAPDSYTRDRMICALKADGISAPFHYIPLHDTPAGRQHGRTAGPLTYTSELSTRLLRLPLFRSLGEDRFRVVERVRHHARALASRRAMAD